MTRFHRIALLAALSVGASSVAHADIITALRSVTQLGDGTYAYTYGVTLSSGSQLIGTATTDHDGNTAAAQFGTVYDFGDVVRTAGGAVIISATGQMNSFNYTFNNSDTPATLAAPYDNPSLGNIRFTYLPTNTLEYVAGDTPTIPAGTAAVIELDSTPDNLGTFTIQSIYAVGEVAANNYDSNTYKTSNNSQQGNAGFVTGPAVPTSVPEPASLALLGAGLVGMGVIRRRTAA